MQAASVFPFNAPLIEPLRLIAKLSSLVNLFPLRVGTHYSRETRETRAKSGTGEG
jgi:hypothetical protein